MRVEEYGSDFHLPVAPEWKMDPSEISFFDDAFFQFYASGRAAFFELVKYGRDHLGWTEVYLPSYYCHEVSHFIQALGIEILFYNSNPIALQETDFEAVPDQSKTALVIVSYFGMETAKMKTFKHASVIEDLTHNLLAVKKSKAQFVFGSLRKELPMPLGGFCYSKELTQITAVSSDKSTDALCDRRIEAMQLKGKYLSGEIVDKDKYRSLFVSTEVQLDEAEHIALPKAALEILQSLDVPSILLEKRSNFELICNELKTSEYFSLMGSEQNRAHFGLTLKFLTSEIRNKFATYLIENKIFPAILWPNQRSAKDLFLEERLVFIHVDFRYDQDDIKKMAQIINSYTIDE
ncbi:MAG: hypothetical protein HKN48_12865 [Flavobacteriaceae bacterium]|nr:hypothetical protein [Flavobacteriaceae bacterium]